MKYTIAALLCAVSLIACAGRSGSTQKKTQAHSKAATEKAAAYGYRIVKAYPHDTGAYTQGLFWHDGFLYESTGEYGHSSLRKVVPESGRTIKQVSLADSYFGEGAAILDGRIYQLTWLEGKAFVYDADSFEKVREFNYSGEGWGITTDGAKLYMSDGSANIAVIDPEKFKTERTIQVRNGGRTVEYVNELEWIDGRIWANIYLTEDIVIINPATGVVEGVIDFRGIESQLVMTRNTDVMNGIAQDPTTGRIFVTGKKWNKLFEVEISRIISKYSIYDQAAQRILVLDGGLGTMVQRCGLSEQDYRGERFAEWPGQLKGCNDILPLTRPDVIAGIHEAYLTAGCRHHIDRQFQRKRRVDGRLRPTGICIRDEPCRGTHRPFGGR